MQHKKTMTYTTYLNISSRYKNSEKYEATI